MKTILCALLLVASTARAGTIFQVHGNLNKEGAQVSGTFDIDTIDGSLDAVDLLVSPITYGVFPTAPVLHYTSLNTGMGHPHGQTYIGGSVVSGWGAAGLSLTLDVPSLVNYGGSQIVPTLSVLNFASGLYVKSSYESSLERYYSLTSGSVTPYVVPEPSSFAMAIILALLLCGTARADKLSDEYTKWKKAEVAEQVETLQQQIRDVQADKSIPTTERTKRAASLRAKLNETKRTKTTVPELGVLYLGTGKLIAPKATVIKVVNDYEAALYVEYTISAKPRYERGKDGPPSYWVMGGTRQKDYAVLRGVNTTAMAPGMVISLPSVVEITRGNDELIIKPWGEK
jgi:hypothetical protein